MIDKRSANADGEHVHTPESGSSGDNATAAGALSGSGDVEHTKRLDILRKMDLADLTPEQQKELEAVEFVRLDRPPQNAQASPTTHIDEEDAAEPEGESREQLGRVQERNQELLDGAKAGPAGERKVGVGRTVTSNPSTTGDYAND